MSKGDENVPLYAYNGTGHEVELTDLITPGTDSVNRVGEPELIRALCLGFTFFECGRVGCTKSVFFLVLTSGSNQPNVGILI